MNIGEAAKASGVSSKMIRYYEEIGLIPAAARSESGYRAYGGNDVHRLRFIRRARDLGFSVAEIGELLGLWNDRTRQSADVKRLAQAHIVELEERIRNLREMADTLQELIGCCAGDERPDCPILATLANAEEDRGTGQGGIPPLERPRGKAFIQE
ncbi:Cu(I)-responsive transcriptional regulator [Massilia sp. GCM10023247]|uniref:Cu(I)-responsive transcriptional regulator n=1 Tax=Massilia sp. GCM10023247 TaxID=3252643 RepID=UPI00361DFFA3